MQDKYKELYDLSRRAFDEEQHGSDYIDDKAARYFGITTFLLGVFGFFGRDILDSSLPPGSVLQWLLLIVGFALFALLLAVTSKYSIRPVISAVPPKNSIAAEIGHSPGSVEL